MSEKIKLTKRAVDALKPPEKPGTFVQVWDTEIPGFGIRVTASGVKSYILNYRIHQRQRKYTIGRHGDFTPDQARQEALRLRSMVASGTDPQEDKRKTRAIPLFKDFADDYLDYVKQKNKSWRNDEGSLNNRLVPKWGKYQLDAITTRQIENMLQSIKEETSPATANRHFSLIQRMFNVAIQWGYVTANPVSHLKKFKENNERVAWLNSDQISNLIEACEDYSNPYTGALFPFLLYTGARLGEALNAQWKNIDIDRALWFIPEAKSGKGRHVYLMPQALDLLANLTPKEGNPYVFCGHVSGKPLNNISKPWKQIKKAAELPEDFRVHDLRHTFASWAASNGIDLYHIQTLLGHSSSVMTQRYAHLAEDGIKASIQRVGEKMSDATILKQDED